MKKNEVGNKITRFFSKAKITTMKHSPEILLVTGVVGTVAGAVMACRATTKVSDILKDTNDQISAIENVASNPQKADVYSEEDARKDKVIVYTQTAVKLAKLYAPAVIIGGLSLTSLVSSNVILRKRNMALTAAYTLIDNSFKDYRKRVVNRFGERVDYELKHDIKKAEIEETIIDENGIEKVVTKEVDILNPNNHSEFAKFFDVGNPNWMKDAEHNLFFLHSQQSVANEKLKAKGYLFLNEVYQMIGIPETKVGQIVGWVYEENNPNGDNYVDFGIYDAYNEKARDFVNGYERSILLDFNVDGIIYDKLP